MPAPTDPATLADLAVFARAEVRAGDIEPWAAVLAAWRTAGGPPSFEEAAWAVKCYNAFDDLGSAFRVVAVAVNTDQWRCAGEATRAAVAALPCGRERRNLRGGGRMLRHLDSYVAALGGRTQAGFLFEPVPRGAGEAAGFDALMGYMRRHVWGTGRQSGFEWAEFAGKALGVPVRAGHGCLWESSGPRQSLEAIYNAGRPARSQYQLDQWAADCKAALGRAGAPLDWWDLETVICDFNVMRKGRYYPGQHLAMITAEIDGCPEPWRTGLRAAYRAVIPAPWNTIAPGVDKELAGHYARTGLIKTPFGRMAAVG